MGVKLEKKKILLFYIVLSNKMITKDIYKKRGVKKC